MLVFRFLQIFFKLILFDKKSWQRFRFYCTLFKVGFLEIGHTKVPVQRIVRNRLRCFNCNGRRNPSVSLNQFCREKNLLDRHWLNSFFHWVLPKTWLPSVSVYLTVLLHQMQLRVQRNCPKPKILSQGTHRSSCPLVCYHFGHNRTKGRWNSFWFEIACFLAHYIQE